MEWFNSLEHLKIEINQKLSKNEREDYQKELNKCVTVLNNYSSEFNKTSNNNDGVFKIKNALRNLEEWLKIKMEENKLFGAKEMEDDGL